MNNVVLIGRLVRDPELRFTPSNGKAVTNFTIAIDRNMSKEKKAEAEQKGYPTADFIPVVVWGKQAENAANYLAKGSQVGISGAIQTSTFKTKEGETRYKTEVLADSVEFLGKKTTNENKSEESDFGVTSSVEDDDDMPF